MKIGLNAGHTLQGVGSGAVGIISESIETRRVSKELKKKFESAGCEVVDCTVDRASTQTAYLQKVVEKANSVDLDWFISIHFNNDAAKKGQGVEAYTYKGRQYPDAVEVCSHIAALGFKNRGVKEGSGLYVIHKTKAKSILIEVCFVNSPDAETYQRMFSQIVKAIAYAMSDYVEAVQKPEAPAVLPEKKRYLKSLVNDLAVRSSLSWDGNRIGTVHKNEVFTIVKGPIKVGKGSMYRLKSGGYITASEKYVSVYGK